MVQSKQINIVWLHSHFLYWMGGTKFIHQVVTQLATSPYVESIIIIVDQISPTVVDQFKQIKNITLISLQLPTSTSVWYWATLPLGIFVRVNRVKQILKANNLIPSNTVAVSSMFPMNAVAALLRMKHLQNCYEPFAFFYDSEFIQQFSTAKKLAIQFIKTYCVPIDIWATRKANKVVTLNSVTQRQVELVYGVPSTCTQAGVNAQLFKPYVSDDISQEFSGKKLIVHSTDYSPVKGTDRVITAFAAVASKHPQALLVITSTIQNESAEAALISLTQNLGIESKVRFLGFVPMHILPQLYSLALVLVQGSSSPKSGTTSMALPVKEAMCCATPVIRSSVGSEDTIHGLTGFICDPTNNDLMAQYMHFFLENPLLSRRMGSWSRKFISKRYTWQKTAEVFLDELQALL